MALISKSSWHKKLEILVNQPLSTLLLELELICENVLLCLYRLLPLVTDDMRTFCSTYQCILIFLLKIKFVQSNSKLPLQPMR